jgi:hypothetical protein
MGESLYLKKSRLRLPNRCNCGGLLALDPLDRWMHEMSDGGWPFQAETVRAIFLEDGPDALVAVCSGCGSVYSRPALASH